MMIRAVRHSIYKSRKSIIRASLVFCLAAATRLVAAASDDVPSAKVAAPVIVIGFVGGFVNHGDNRPQHGPSRCPFTATTIRQGCMWRFSRIVTGKKARTEIIQIVDVDHDGKLSAEEKKNARIILYGHSWGASETVTLARELERDGIPVLLTVQVDSVAKPAENDKVIPANVAEAVKFLSTEWLCAR